VISARTITAGYAGLGAWRSAEIAKGVSPDAAVISSRLEQLITGLIQSATSVHQITEPIEELITLYKDCVSPNWDNEGALPISESALRDACDLILLLPTAVGRPSFSPEPMGAIAFEWYRSPTHIVVLSVNGSRSIQYAAILGEGNESHGRVNFPGSLPRPVQRVLEEYRYG